MRTNQPQPDSSIVRAEPQIAKHDQLNPQPEQAHREHSRDATKPGTTVRDEGPNE